MAAAKGDQSDPSLIFPFADWRRSNSSAASRDGSKRHTRATRDGEEHELAVGPVKRSGVSSNARIVVRDARAGTWTGLRPFAFSNRAKTHGTIGGLRTKVAEARAARAMDDPVCSPVGVHAKAISRGTSYALDRRSESPTRAQHQHSHQPQRRRRLCRARGAGPVLRIPRHA